MTHRMYFRPETGYENRFGHAYGPFEWLQLTYSELRISPDGDSAMALSVDAGKWIFASNNGIKAGHGLGVVAHPDDADKEWSDIVIFESDEPVDGAVAPIVQQMKAVKAVKADDMQPFLEARTPETPPMTYNNIIEWLAADTLGSTEWADDIEDNVDRYMEDLTKAVQTKAEEIGV